MKKLASMALGAVVFIGALPIAGGPAAAQVADQPTLELSVTEIDVASYGGAAAIPVYYKGTALTSTAGTLVALDGGGQGPADLRVVFRKTAPAFDTAGKDPHFWKGEMVVSNMPTGGEYQRTVLLQLGELTGATLYTLKNSKSAAPSWQLAPPPKEWVLSSGRKATVAVTVGERPIHDLKIVQSSLQDPDSKATLGLDMIQIDGKPNPVPSLEPNTTSRLQLEIPDSFEEPGAFAGNVTFAVADDAAHKNVELLVYSRPLARVWIGIALIALGLALSWIAGVWLARRASRAAALNSLDLTGRRLPRFRAAVAEVEAKGEKVLHFRRRTDSLAAALDPQRIAKLLPPPVWQPTLKPWDKAPFETHLETQAQLATALSEVTTRGLEHVLAEWAASDPASVKAAIAALDQLLAPPASLDLATVRGGVDAAIALLVPLPGIADTSGPRRSLPGPTALERRQLELATIGFARWTLWAVLTVVIGYVVLIVSDLGFGSEADLVKCFFWGLGVQGASEGFDQLTRDRSAGVVGLELPQ